MDYTPPWAEKVIASMDNGQWTQAVEQMTAGVRRKPEAATARGLRLTGLLHERRGVPGLNAAARLMRALERRATQP